MSKLRIVINGLITENPTFVLLLGMCPTLGTTATAITGMSMGLATMCVLICSNCAVSAIKSVVPSKVRIPVYIVVIATFVTILQMLMKAYLPALDAALGIFIPLIVVNCILLGRAEAFAGKNGIFASMLDEAFASRHSVVDSMLDGLGIGLGFTAALTLLGVIREFLGAGTVFGLRLYSDEFASLVFILAPGAFIVLGLMIALFNRIRKKC